MTGLQKKIFIIGGILLAVILITALVFWFYNPFNKKIGPQTTSSPKANSGQNGMVAGPEEALTPAPEAVPVSPVKPAVSPDTFYVQQLARIFTERFFSFSNQNQNQHITDALALASPSMVSWIQKQALEQGTEYQGVNTAVVASSIKNLEIDKATVIVNAQRIFEGAEVKKEYKTGRVELVKENEIWKVKGFYWE